MTDRFPIYMVGFGTIDSLGDKEIYCTRNDLGLYLTFRETRSTVVLEEVDIFPSYTTVSPETIRQSVDMALKEVAPSTLFPIASRQQTTLGVADIARAQSQQLLKSLSYDIALIRYLELGFGAACSKDTEDWKQGTHLARFEIFYECSSSDGAFSANLIFDNFGRRLMRSWIAKTPGPDASKPIRLEIGQNSFLMKDRRWN